MMRLDRREVINRDLELGDAVGAGAYGEVFMAAPIQRNRRAGSDYPPRFVVKVIRGELCTPDFVECAGRELRAVSGLRHPCVVEYIDAWVEAGPGSYQGSYCVAMHYCDGGDLHDYISVCIKRRRRPSPAVVVRVMACVLGALNYCHTRHVIHRDIKPANVFLVRSEDGGIERALVGDFGLARPLGNSRQMVATRVGTPCYCSPEIVSAESYTSKTDIFSAGATFYELMALERPFWKPQYTDLEVFERILHSNPIPRLSALCAGRFDASLTRLVSLCLGKYEARRPSAYFLLTHIGHVHDEVLRMHLPLYTNRGDLCAGAGEGTDEATRRGRGAARGNSAGRQRGCARRAPSRAAVAVPPGASAEPESASASAPAPAPVGPVGGGCVV